MWVCSGWLSFLLCSLSVAGEMVLMVVFFFVGIMYVLLRFMSEDDD